MKTREIAKIFKKKFKSPNFMTPNILGYVDRGNYLVELSTGRGMTGQIYGVTVLKLGFGGPKNSDLSKMFHSLREANNYIESI